jgi:hypothetical protein
VIRFRSCTLPLLLGLCVTFAALAGCTGDMRSGGNWLNPFRPPGEEWSIMCMEFLGPDRAKQAEEVAATLRRTPGVDPAKVKVVNEDDKSRLYYGNYYRTPDKRTGKLRIPSEMRADMEMIKNLAVNGQRFFYESRVLPAPTPDVGEPEWRIENNPGVYTLRIALFYNEPGFSERKKAAAAYCRELREKGYEAWYHHGDITSEVFVGSFPEDALIQRRKSGVLINEPGPTIRALQARENFRFELWNLKTRRKGSGSGQLVRASRVVSVGDRASFEDIY